MSETMLDHAVNCAWQDGTSNCDCNMEGEIEYMPCYGNGCPRDRTCAACKYPVEQVRSPPERFPRTALGQTDQLGHDRDESEARRAGAIQSELTCTELVSDVPSGPICPLCNVPYGSWSPVHTKPGEARPCQWSWDVQKKAGAR